jgi:hypothetical protein
MTGSTLAARRAAEACRLEGEGLPARRRPQNDIITGFTSFELSIGGKWRWRKELAALQPA